MWVRERLGAERVSERRACQVLGQVSVVSFSADSLIPPMCAHYADKSGFVTGYNTDVMKELGINPILTVHPYSRMVTSERRK